jgi:membrane associated rhomboid family serine protease
MSLQYEKEVEEAETSAEQTENVQRVLPVFPIYSVIIVVCLIAVFVCQVIVDGQDSILTGGDKSVFLAGFDKPLFAAGEYWRILTGAVLHGGLIHLIFNCYALYSLGRIIETLSNRAHLAVVFILAAIGGGLLSLAFLPAGTSIGASGGIIGFLGYLTVYGFKRRKIISSDFLKNMIFNIVFIAVMGVFIIPNVDNFGHLGGLLVGGIYGLIQIPSDVYRDPRKVGGGTETIGLAALGITIAISVFSGLILLKAV